MRICLIVEGCYPYTVGGVSSWTHTMIERFPEHEFVIYAISASRAQRGKFRYRLPKNVSAVYETYLSDNEYGQRRFRRLDRKAYAAMRSLVMGDSVDWDGVFDLVSGGRFSPAAFLMGPDFLGMVRELYTEKYPTTLFADFLWTMRSILLPLLLTLGTPVPRADVYHCVATGYAGVIGAMGKHLYGGRLLISEHGIYTREREEELIKAKWVQGIYKRIWTRQFYLMSHCAYDNADVVTSLYAAAQKLQIEMGCPKEKAVITPNGIDVNRFSNIPVKSADDPYVNVGAVLRIAPIKDVKTLISAFYYAKQENPGLKLWLMGPYDADDPYVDECFTLIRTLGLTDVEITGNVDVTQYLGRMDFLLLTSISEGQPLTILEGFAAGIPSVTTNVGNCQGLIEGEDGDTGGAAGIVCPVMDTMKLKDAILRLSRDPALTREMGRTGLRRVREKYTVERMRERYDALYRSLDSGKGGNG